MLQFLEQAVSNGFEDDLALLALQPGADFRIQQLHLVLFESIELKAEVKNGVEDGGCDVETLQILLSALRGAAETIQVVGRKQRATYELVEGKDSWTILICGGIALRYLAGA